MPTAKVKIHYRRFYRVSDSILDDPLSQSVKNALHTKKGERTLFEDVRLRRYEDFDDSTLILNGRNITDSGSVFGELVRFNSDTDIPLLMNSVLNGELEIRSAAKPNDAEFLSGMCFFSIVGDHVFLIERDLGFPSIERYLRWLLCTQTSTASHDGRIHLIPSALLDAKDHLLGEVKKMVVNPRPRSFGGLFEVRNEDACDDSAPTKSNVLEILKSALFDTSAVEKIARQRDTSIDVSVQILFRRGHKHVSVTGEEAMTMLRNIPEEDLIINGEHSRRNRGTLERLKKDATIERKGNILDRGGAWAALDEVARQYREAGLING